MFFAEVSKARREVFFPPVLGQECVVIAQNRAKVPLLDQLPDFFWFFAFCEDISHENPVLGLHDFEQFFQLASTAVYVSNHEVNHDGLSPCGVVVFWGIGQRCFLVQEACSRIPEFLSLALGPEISTKDIWIAPLLSDVAREAFN